MTQQDLPEYQELINKMNHQLSTTVVERIDLNFKE